MRDLLKSRVGWSSAAWLLPLAFFTLPNCSFDGRDPEPADSNHAVFCDIEWPLGRHCATDSDKEKGILFSQAAVALNAGQTSNIGLDDSPAALALCGGEPEAVLFRCPYPEGCPVCLRPTAIGPPPAYPNVAAVCVQRCLAFFGEADGDGTFTPDYPPAASVTDWCQHNSHAATNWPGDTAFPGICTNGGVVRPEFDDPSHPGFPDLRRVPRPVQWTNRVGVAVSGLFSNTLKRTKDTTGMFDAGATSVPVINNGDAFFEFTPASDPAGPTFTERVMGFASGTPQPDLSGIQFGLDVSNGGNVYLVENGTVTTFLGTYTPTDRFRISIESGLFKCYRNGMLLLTNSPAASHPLRIDASLLEKGAVLADVNIIYLK